MLLVEPFALDDKFASITTTPMAVLLCTASSAICTPNSLSQYVALGLGAQAGEARLREVLEQAGYTSFRRAAETPLNLILEARRDPHGQAGATLGPGPPGFTDLSALFNTTFVSGHLLLLARTSKNAGDIPAHGDQRSEWNAGWPFDFTYPEQC